MYKYIHRSIILIISLLWGLQNLYAQEVLSPRIANYYMDIHFDDQSKKLIGETDLIWYNPSQDSISYVLLHMYYNAFRNSNSTFFKERGVPEFLSEDIDNECGWGWTHIVSIKDGQGNDLTNRITYVNTDDNNIEDKTVLKVPLAKSIWGEEFVSLRLEWEAKIPKTMPRTGYNKDYYFFAQWFPKIGVYEPQGMRYRKNTGAWNCHQYHSAGEYYADFGNYEVKINAPSNYILGSTGSLIGQEKKSDRKVWHFKAEDVIDFTWTASPHYQITRDKYEDTEILIYTYPEKTKFVERYLATIKFCMEYLDDHLGPYPYPTLSIIDPPIHGLFTGGMEYPRLITSLSFESFPAGFQTIETLVIHEYIHQYFMQMVATHEVEEAWMDEGFTTYYENRILDAYCGPEKSTIDFLGIKIGSKEWNRTEFLNSENPKIASNARKSWQYKHGGYGEISYNKTAMWLQTMEGLIGTELMDKVMKSYFEKWKFKHPCRTDFINLTNEIVRSERPQQFPNGMDWYFEQVLFGTNVCDYAVASIENKLILNERGFFEDHENCKVIERSDTLFASKVILHRLGEITLPVEVLLTLEDGSQSISTWDGKDRSSEIVLNSEKKIISAHLDPNQRILLDHNLLNNTKCLPEEEIGIRGLSWKVRSIFQHILETLSLLI